jgi:hypothetical protein
MIGIPIEAASTDQPDRWALEYRKDVAHDDLQTRSGSNEFCGERYSNQE